MRWMNIIVPGWLKNIHHRIFGKWDHKLLVNNPDLWRIKPHYFIIYSLIIANIVLVGSYLIFPEPEIINFGMTISGSEFLMAGAGLFVLIIWAIYQSRTEIVGNSLKSSIITLLLSAFCVLSVSVNVGLTSLLTNAKYMLVQPDEKFERDFKVLNASGFFRTQWYHDYLFSDEYAEFTSSAYFQNIHQYLKDGNLFAVGSRADEMVEGIPDRLNPDYSSIYREWERFAYVAECFEKMKRTSSSASNLFQPLTSSITILLAANTNWSSYNDQSFAISQAEGKNHPAYENFIPLEQTTDNVEAYSFLKKLQFTGEEPKFYRDNRFEIDSTDFWVYRFGFLEDVPEQELLQLGYHVFLKEMEDLFSEDALFTFFDQDTVSRLAFIEENRLQTLIERKLAEDQRSYKPEIIKRDGRFIGVKDFYFAESLYRNFSKIKEAKSLFSSSEGISLYKLIYYGLFLTMFLPTLLIMLTYTPIVKLMYYLVPSVMLAGFFAVLAIYLGGWNILQGGTENYIKVLVYFSAFYAFGWFLVKGWVRVGHRTNVKDFLAVAIYLGIPCIGIGLFIFYFEELMLTAAYHLSLPVFLIIVLLVNILSGFFAHDFIRYQSLPED
ncbi:MAG: hypothetical protein AAF502_02420 [Bacteroidota bacterium]